MRVPATPLLTREGPTQAGGGWGTLGEEPPSPAVWPWGWDNSWVCALSRAPPPTGTELPRGALPCPREPGQETTCVSRLRRPQEPFRWFWNVCQRWKAAFSFRSEGPPVLTCRTTRAAECRRWPPLPAWALGTLPLTTPSAARPEERGQGPLPRRCGLGVGVCTLNLTSHPPSVDPSP